MPERKGENQEALCPKRVRFPRFVIENAQFVIVWLFGIFGQTQKKISNNF